MDVSPPALLVGFITLLPTLVFSTPITKTSCKPPIIFLLCEKKSKPSQMFHGGV